MPTTLEIPWIKLVSGKFEPPPDKSIFHRAILVAAIGKGHSVIDSCPPGLDCLATLELVQKLGAELVRSDSDGLEIKGVSGIWNLKEPKSPVDCSNSGTTARLGAGLCCGVDGLTILSGDASLSERPMDRIVRPLSLMGARITARAGNRCLPMAITGRFPLHPIEFTPEIASAQVKSAILLAGTGAEGPTKVFESTPTRDHTERFLRFCHIDCRSRDGETTILGPCVPDSFRTAIPGDPSSAAFMVVMAAIKPKSNLVVKNVCLNPRRIGYIDLLKKMGADINVMYYREAGLEPSGDIIVRGGRLSGVSIVPQQVVDIIDEIPVLAVAMAVAEGRSSVIGASELRKKESDRIRLIVAGLRAFGCDIEEYADGFSIAGGKPEGCPELLESGGDHRIAMALSVMASTVKGTTRITHPGCVDVSFPGFEKTLHRLKSI